MRSDLTKRGFNKPIVEVCDVQNKIWRIMSFKRSALLWKELCSDKHSDRLSRDLLDLRGTSMWLELLIDHPELLGSQMYFHEEAQRYLLLPEYTAEQRVQALWGLFMLFEEQPKHQICNQIDVSELAGLLFYALEYSDKNLERSQEVLLKRLFLSSVFIEAGTFEQGAHPNESHTYDWERPRHKVRLTRSFYMFSYPVTQFLYARVCGQNPSLFNGLSRPVEHVSWYDALYFANKLSEDQGLEPVYSQIEGVPKVDFLASGWRLPTESEWEYAARAGGKYRYSGTDDLQRCAWFWDNGGVQTQPVGQKIPNAFGLYDMTGNVFEWCWDGYDSDCYRHSARIDPGGAADELIKVRRGGSWYRPRVDQGLVRRFHTKGTEKSAEQGFRLCRTSLVSKK
ncbi:MAG: hypothetical protein CMK59_08180 [Proteobacteria bacterium]|nr:hypothetical protein [Pseudomonadota bacterium]